MATVTVDGVTPAKGNPRRLALQRATQLAELFTAACSWVGLAEDSVSAAGIPGTSCPRVTHVELGQRPYLMVRLLPGQLVSDLREEHARIAPALGYQRIRLTPRRHGLVRVDLDPVDPLEEELLCPGPVDSVREPVVFGALEHGGVFQDSLLNTGHLTAQGQTWSGKTRWAYGLLSQLVGVSDVVIDGIDPTSKLLGPWQGTAPSGWISTDTDYAAMLEVTDRLVAEMRARTQGIPRHRDALQVSSDWPLRLVVLEEWPNVLTHALQAVGRSRHQQTRLAQNVQILLAESHKAGFRLLLLAQRMEADLVGGFNRDNISHRLSFRCASKDALKLLHEGIDDLTAQAHASERAGFALVQAPQLPRQRLRAPTVADYADYVQAVDQVGPVTVDTAA